ncbi:MAG: hypothetical protein HYR76_01170 [Ignavibacteria bacterium]|nr:hypothetical protein [Ignavibacteria bacterium]
MNCSHCGREVTGRVIVRSLTLAKALPVVQMESTPERDWICCDACNTIICHDCCCYPTSGYCDTCIEKYKLHDHLAQIGLIPGREDHCL